MKIEKRIINKFPFATSRLTRSCAASGVINLGIIFIFVILLTNCFSPLGGQEEIGVTISLGPGQSRNFFSAEDYSRRVLEVTTPGREHTFELKEGEHSVTISGRPGTWHIYVLYYDNVLLLPTAGASLSPDIQMGPPITIDIEKEMDIFDEIPISNEEDLRRIAALQGHPTANVLTRNFVLTRNINLSSAPWTPIGKDLLDTQYTGTFDGNGHTISGLTINSSDNNQGMFGVIGNGGIVKNLGLLNVNITGNNNVGGLVGISTTIGNNTIQHSYVTGTVNGNDSVGGVVGNNNGTVQNSYSTGAVSGNLNVGGVVGSNNSASTVRNSYSTGTVSGNAFVGGVVGSNQMGSTVTNSYSTSIVDGNQTIGGVVGSNNGIVEYCYATGNVSGNDTVGGVVGSNSSDSNTIIRYSYATGNVSGTGAGSSIGGVAGNNFRTMEYSYATGNVSGNNRVGGVVGLILSGKVSNCYATGAVSGTSAVGGVAGSTNVGNNIVIEYSYATGAVSGNFSTGGVVGSLESPMQNIVALNPSITRTGLATTVGRVAYINISNGTINNGYARSNMQFIGFTTPPTVTSNSNDIHGEDINADQYHNAGWWITNGWNATNNGFPIWDIADNRLPRLIGVGGNQNPVIQQP